MAAHKYPDPDFMKSDGGMPSLFMNIPGQKSVKLPKEATECGYILAQMEKWLEINKSENEDCMNNIM